MHDVSVRLLPNIITIYSVLITIAPPFAAPAPLRLVLALYGWECMTLCLGLARSNREGSCEGRSKPTRKEHLKKVLRKCQVRKDRLSIEGKSKGTEYYVSYQWSRRCGRDWGKKSRLYFSGKERLKKKRANDGFQSVALSFALTTGLQPVSAEPPIGPTQAAGLALRFLFTRNLSVFYSGMERLRAKYYS